VSHGSGLCLPERAAKPFFISLVHSPPGAGGHVTAGVTKAPVDVQATTVCLYSAASVQLTTPGHGYRDDMTRQDGTMVRAIFSTAER
jgi:hypothetical protein